MMARVKYAAIFFVLGTAGIASIYLVPLELLIPEGEIDAPSSLLRLLLLVQPSIFVALAIILGLFLSPKVGLQAPLFRALSGNGSAGPVLMRQMLPALVIGGGAAAVLYVYGLYTDPYFDAAGSEVLKNLEALDPPLLTKILYGGVVEELMMRWGFMTFVVWAVWRMKGRPEHVPSGVVWTGIVIAAAVFALGHLPLLFGISAQPPVQIIVAVLIGNALPGVGFGWLYHRFGLESAMVAHGLTHIFATIAISLLPIQ